MGIRALKRGQIHRADVDPSVRRVHKYCTTPEEPVENLPQGLEPDRLIAALGELGQALKEQGQVR